MPCQKCGGPLDGTNHNVWSNLCAECELGLRFIQNLINTFKYLHVLTRRRLER